MKRPGPSLLYFLIVFLSALSFGAAQRPAEATDLLREARATVIGARQTYSGTIYTIDQPLWRDALALGNEALELAPDDAEISLFLAQTYSEIGWLIRAWDAWQRYLDLGEALDETAARQFADTGERLGFARYDVGDYAGALEFYERVLREVPEATESLVWLGRIRFERGEADLALPYWNRLTELEPDNEGYAYYRSLVEQAISVGTQASSAFQTGLRAYEEGDLEASLPAFEEAIEANPEFGDAYVWAGRTSLELGQPGKAERYWRRVIALDPADDRAVYFAAFAADQQRWGVAAASAFYEGQRAYEAGDLTTATERFDYAALVNPAYTDALVWAARSSQEAGKTAQALSYWQEVLSLDPEDERASYFKNLAEQELTYGSEAGRAFVGGIEQFQGANLEEAEALFRAAVAANPDFADAWGWLGRTLFARANYAEASTAYERALELEPSNDDYRYFAEEARFLSGEN